MKKLCKSRKQIKNNFFPEANSVRSFNHLWVEYCELLRQVDIP